MSDTVTMMILDHMVNRLMTDTVFRDWCVTNLGSHVNVFVGLNRDDLPPKSRYPLVVLYDVSRVERGNSEDVHTYRIELGAGVFDKTLTQGGTAGQGESFVFRGFRLSQGLRDQAELAIYKLGLNEQWSVMTNGDTVNDNADFYWRTFSLITIKLKAGRQKPITKQ